MVYFNKENIDVINQKLSESEVFKAILDRAIARKGDCPILISGCEKWNHPTEKNNWGKDSEAPNADGLYDVEGHCWTDIYGYARLNLFDPVDCIVYFNSIKEWWKDTKDIWSFKYFKSSIKFIFNSLNVFSLNREYWIWTVESFDVLKSDLIDEKVSAYYGEKERSVMRKDFEGWKETCEKFRKETSYKEVLARANEELIKINDYMYVYKTDPTVIVIDHELQPYDMKDGYSNRMICQFLHVWFCLVAGVNFKIYEKNRPRAFSKINKSIKLGMLDVERGNFSEYKPFGDEDG